MLGLAILHKQTRFIRNIIDREANIKTFLTVERFETMLRKNTPENSMLYELLQDKCDDPDDWKFEHFEMVSLRIPSAEEWSTRTINWAVDIK